jgi:Sulfotransferase family
VLELNPALPSAYAGLAVLGEKATDPSALDQLRTLLADPDCSESTRIDAGFALGRLLDNIGHYDEAFSSFADANAAGRRMLAGTGVYYNNEAMRLLVDSLIASCTSEFFAAVEGEGNPSELPVFDVGMPRSGTTLVEQIAASHSRVFGADEQGGIGEIVEAVQAHAQGRTPDQLDPDFARRLADQYVAHLERLGGGAVRVIDKMLDNIAQLGMIAVLFPKARVVYCRRDLRDVGRCRATFRNLTNRCLIATTSSTARCAESRSNGSPSTGAACCRCR